MLQQCDFASLSFFCFFCLLLSFLSTTDVCIYILVLCRVGKRTDLTNGINLIERFFLTVNYQSFYLKRSTLLLSRLSWTQKQLLSRLCLKPFSYHCKWLGFLKKGKSFNSFFRFKDFLQYFFEKRECSRENADKVFLRCW